MQPFGCKFTPQADTWKPDQEKSAREILTGAFNFSGNDYGFVVVVVVVSSRL